MRLFPSLGFHGFSRISFSIFALLSLIVDCYLTYACYVELIKPYNLDSPHGILFISILFTRYTAGIASDIGLFAGTILRLRSILIINIVWKFVIVGADIALAVSSLKMVEKRFSNEFDSFSKQEKTLLNWYATQVWQWLTLAIVMTYASMRVSGFYRRLYSEDAVSVMHESDILIPTPGLESHEKTEGLPRKQPEPSKTEPVKEKTHISNAYDEEIDAQRMISDVT